MSSPCPSVLVLDGQDLDNVLWDRTAVEQELDNTWTNTVKSVQSNCSFASLNPLPSLCAVPGRGREAHSRNPSSSFDGQSLDKVGIWCPVLVQPTKEHPLINICFAPNKLALSLGATPQERRRPSASAGMTSAASLTLGQELGREITKDGLH